MHRSLLRVFGLALMAALGVMAFSAVAAQAEVTNRLTDGGTAGKFLVLGLTSLVVGTEVTGEQLGAGKLLLPDFAPAYIKCEKGDVNEGVGISESEVLAKVTFLECDTYEEVGGSEVSVPACKVVGSPGGELTVTATAIAVAKLHGEELFVLFKPEKDAQGKELNFTTLKFSSECGFGATVNIKGSVVALVDTGNVSEATHKILFSREIQELFQKEEAGEVKGDRLRFGAHESYIDATADVKLTGKHVGCGWAVH